VIREEPEPPENAERWLISYADFITLLMVFFVVLYSMSKVDAGKYEALSQSLNAALAGGTGVLDDVNPGVISPDSGGAMSNPKSTPDNDGGKAGGELENMEGLEGRLKTYFTEHGLNKSVSMNIDGRGLVISLNDTILFDPGKAAIKNEALAELVAVGQALNTQDNYIRVEGHTDNVPINTAQFASNWELSAARATTVVRFLIDMAGIPPEKLSAVGYGEYKPVADNATFEGRGKNRRVDIILLSSAYNNLEE
jgi:chemotaxis protein MotB